MRKKQKRDLYSPDEFDQEEKSVSRSQLKREMHALQQLGADMAALGNNAVRKAGLPPRWKKPCCSSAS